MNDKIEFEDIFDLKDIEKVFEQTLEFDILKLMDKWHQENKEKAQHKVSPLKKDEQQLYIEKIVRQVLKEELKNMINSKSLFNESFCKQLEFMSFERNCPTCVYNANKQYGVYSHREIM